MVEWTGLKGWWVYVVWDVWDVCIVYVQQI